MQVNDNLKKVIKEYSDLCTRWNEGYEYVMHGETRLNFYAMVMKITDPLFRAMDEVLRPENRLVFDEYLAHRILRSYDYDKDLHPTDERIREEGVTFVRRYLREDHVLSRLLDFEKKCNRMRNRGAKYFGACAGLIVAFAQKKWADVKNKAKVIVSLFPQSDSESF
jgi:hypothetical protein